MKDRIRKVMETQHMTQQVFAEFLGIAPATLSSIFTGRTRPTLQVVEAIKSKIPTISTDWIMFGSGDMTTSNNDNTSTLSSETRAESVNEPVLAFDDSADLIEPQRVRQSTPQISFQEQMQVVKNIDKYTRKITEIRIFYDDQTWETFVPKK